jgi:hypothetical protein
MAGMKPKLTLRDLFWLVLVCALALGWWMRERTFELEQLSNDRWEVRATELRRICEEHGWTVDFPASADPVHVWVPRTVDPFQGEATQKSSNR